MIRLEDGIYNVDVTWCDNREDPTSRRWYDHFIRSDEAFAKNGHQATTGVQGTGVFAPCPYES